ncbi:MAG: DUF2911 domain-containing protein [Bacteroidota bacterium]
MKKLILSLFVVALAYTLQAQINTPSPSPFSKLEQQVGLTDVTIEYSRPSVKGRELFVEVEKWGKVWRTGANASSKITFSDDVKVEGQAVPKGTYAIYSIPDPKEFTIMLYKDLRLGGNVGKYDQNQEQIRFKVNTVTMPVSMETFAFMIDEITTNSAVIAFMWGNYYVPFKMEVEVDSRVTKNIEQVMAGPSRNDFYTAARYYYSNDKDQKQALKWIQQANNIDAKFWQLRLEAQILAKMGRYKDAIATIEKSTTAAKEAGNMDYPDMNARSAAQWKGKLTNGSSGSGSRTSAQ